MDKEKTVLKAFVSGYLYSEEGEVGQYDKEDVFCRNCKWPVEKISKDEYDCHMCGVKDADEVITVRQIEKLWRVR
jgi:hypothetical protein